MAVHRCANDGKPAAFQCVECGTYVCEDCVKHSVGSAGTAMLCPMCGRLVRALVATSLGRRERSFWYYAGTALVWPLVGRGPLVVLINALFVGIFLAVAVPVPTILVAALLAPPTLTVPAGIYLGLAITALGLLFLYAYLTLLFFKTVQGTALGDDPLPMTPIVESFSTTVMALIRVIVVYCLWTVPAVVVSHWVDGFPHSLPIIVLMGVQGPGALVWLISGPESSTVVRVVAGLGLLFLPMSLLAVATFESVRRVNPLGVVGCIMRVPLQYVCCCVLFYLLPVLISLFLGAVFWVTAEYLMSIRSVLDIREVTATFVAMYFGSWAVYVYSLFVQGRVLGGLCAGNKGRFGWVRSPE